MRKDDIRILDLQTLLEKPSRFAWISHVLAQGGILIYPTETLYGLGCDPFAPGNPMERIARLKRRPADRPFLFLIPDARYLGENGVSLPAPGQRLAARFWPGPLTLILPVPSTSPLAPLTHGGSIAVRVSPHPFVHVLFTHRRFPLVSTSANPSGAPDAEARDPARMLENFRDRVDFFVTEGPLRNSPPSTLLDLRVSPPRLLREGGLTFDQLKPFL